MSVTLSQLQASGVLASGFRLTDRAWLPCSLSVAHPSCCLLSVLSSVGPLWVARHFRVLRPGVLLWQCFPKVKVFFLSLKFWFLVSGFSWLLAESTEKGKSKVFSYQKFINT